MENILYATLVISLLGLVFGCLLGIASKIFKVEKDERVDKILNILPGANCGGCGYAGCSQFAEYVVSGKAACTDCSAGGENVAKAIAEIIGAEDTGYVKKAAYVRCAGCKSVASDKYEYSGVKDCVSASKLLGGSKACGYGCMGLGSCVEACSFGAISIENGIAKIDYTKCGGCGNCAKACPKGIINVISDKDKYIVECMNKEKGALLKGKCSVGCIGCGICMKNCPSGAIAVKDFLATIDPEKCTGCGICEEKCPKKIIKAVNKSYIEV